MKSARACKRWWLACTIVTMVWAAAHVVAAAVAPLPRHPLELEALSDPEGVRLQLPALIDAAKSSGDLRTLALLHIAEANACRVIADWQCQRRAGTDAVNAAERSQDTLLIVRGLIHESRGRMALQDYTGGEQVLGRAELLLKETPHPDLAGDIYIAYSSMSNAIGKYRLAVEYAERGLQQLGSDAAASTRARLLRNLARAQVQLGNRDQARAALEKGAEAAGEINDPKLSAEMYLESARLARQDNDREGVQSNVAQAFVYAQRLKNSQLRGQGHEIVGQAAIDDGDLVLAIKELRTAMAAFQALGLKRDELRVARQLMSALLDSDAAKAEMTDVMRRVVDLDQEVLSSERAQAADDFDARLKYAEQQLDVVRLQAEAMLATERADALTRTSRLSMALGLLSAVTLLVVSGFFWQQRRSNQRLRTAMMALRESESRAVDVLRLSRGYVFLHDRDGKLLMANPAVAEALGQHEEQLIGKSLASFVVDADQSTFSAYLERVHTEGQDEGVLRLRHRRGSERSWRYSARLNTRVAERTHVIGHAVDVTDQVEQTEALREQNLHDELTGCFNRRYLVIFERQHGSHDRWAVINIDLDHFKHINDSQGHERGDQVLKEMTLFLQQRVREGDAVVRAGGDEFLLLLADADERAVEDITMRLRQDRPMAACAFSMGQALRDAEEPLSDTLARADAHMYRMRSWARAEVAEKRRV